MNKQWEKDFEAGWHAHDGSVPGILKAAIKEIYGVARQTQLAADLKIADNYADVVDGVDGPSANLALTIASEIRAQLD